MGVQEYIVITESKSVYYLTYKKDIFSGANDIECKKKMVE